MLGSGALLLAGFGALLGVSAASGAAPHSAHGSYHELLGDTCVTPSDCWAVGFTGVGGGAKLGQALHYNGKKWSRVSVPEPQGKSSKEDFDSLNGVWCRSRSDCWAVGDYGRSYPHKVTVVSRSEALHWNGKKWKLVPTPNPGGTSAATDTNALSGITCTAAASCWATGDQLDGSQTEVNEALHWNGKAWTSVPTPNPSGTGSLEGNTAASVTCIKSTDCWIAGYGNNSSGASDNETLHWNGTSWSAVPVPQPGYGGLSGISCPSAADCWAVGTETRPGGDINEAMHWNGSAWSQVATPNPSGTASGDNNLLFDLACASGSDCWAVGFYTISSYAQLNQVLHWNGTKWSQSGVPQPTGRKNVSTNNLYGVTCAKASDCWAVGTTDIDPKPLRNELLRFNGKKWSKG